MVSWLPVQNGQIAYVHKHNPVFVQQNHSHSIIIIVCREWVGCSLINHFFVN